MPAAELQTAPSLAPPQLDAWVFARALSDFDVGNDVTRVSEPNRPLTMRLAEAQLNERATIWNDHLATLREDETNAWIEAVAAVNPNDEPPEDESWPQPLVLKLPPVLPFPLDILPPSVRRLVDEVATSINCPPDFPAMAALTVAGGAIGRSASLRLKSGYFVPSSLYVVCVGLAGDGKSPAIEQVVSPMIRIDEVHFEKYQTAKAEFESLQAQFDESARCSRRSRAGRSRTNTEGTDDADSDGAEPDMAPDMAMPKKPTPPILRRNVIRDITSEAMDSVMAQNPRGLIQVLDEASTLTSSMNQYRGGKGSDRQRYMSVWSGQALTVDRKGNADLIPIRVPHPFLSIIGGMVPSMVGSFCDEKGRHDGFVDRILFIYPDKLPKPGWNEKGLSDETATEWSEILSRPQFLPLIEENGRTKPHVVQFSKEGKRAWVEMFNEHHAEQRSADFAESMFGPWAKLEQYVGRIILTLHLLGRASDPTSDGTQIPEVTPETVWAAAQMLTYIKSHTRRAHSAMRARARGEEGSDDVQSILGWIYRHGPESFSTRDLTRDLSKTFAKRAHALHEALGWLTTRHCIRLKSLPSGSRKKGAGRYKSLVYLVNPQLLASQNCQNLDFESQLDGPRDRTGDYGDFATAPAVSGGKEDGDDARPY